MPAEHLTTTMTLDRLLKGVAIEGNASSTIANLAAIAVADITIDSRRVTPGGLFLACAGARHHGLEFWESAVNAGACAIVYDPDGASIAPQAADVPLIPVVGLKDHLGKIAERFFQSPSRDLNVIGVTGTNGKTTVAWLIAQCFAAIGRKCAYAGTLGYGVADLVNDDDMTTPDAIEMHRRLALFRDAGASHAAIEVSSHALDQGRVDGVTFQSTVLTNLSREHLDYHGDMRNYAEAKAKLFTDHEARHRIINIDSEFGIKLASRCDDNVIVVSTRTDRVDADQAFVFVRSVNAQRGGMEFSFHSSWGDATTQLPMCGDFNVANAVTVLALMLGDGVELKTACAALENIQAPPGRLQRVPSSHGPDVYIDYAHSPDALDVALRALRTHCTGNLWCVFGCGGDRDAGKRPVMGRIAEQLADCVVITSDNPRSEPPSKIIEQIQAGLSHPDDAVVIEDRAAAIGFAVANARGNDVVLLAGKGHENYQIIGTKRVDFSDFDIAAATLQAAEAGA